MVMEENRHSINPLARVGGACPPVIVGHSSHPIPNSGTLSLLVQQPLDAIVNVISVVARPDVGAVVVTGVPAQMNLICLEIATEVLHIKIVAQTPHEFF